MQDRLKKTFDWFATALVAVAAGLFIWTQVESRWLREPPRRPIQEVEGLSIASSAIRHVRGHGPIALVEFTDYECPACGDYALRTAPLVDKQLVDSGAVRHVIFNFPLEQIHPRARRAAEAAECAARQGHYRDMHKHLFSDRHNLEADRIVDAVKAFGLDEARFTQCLSGEAASAITKDMEEGARLGVTGTPTLFVGAVQADGSITLLRRLNGAASFDAIKRVSDDVRRLINVSR